MMPKVRQAWQTAFTDLVLEVYGSDICIIVYVNTESVLAGVLVSKEPILNSRRDVSW